MKFLDLSRIISLPGRNVFGLVVSGVNKPEIYVAIAKLLAKYNILPVSSFTNSSNGEVEMTFFLDFSSSKISFKKLSERLKRIAYVKSIEHIKPLSEGLIVDTYHFPLTVSSERACIFRKSVLKGLFKDIKEKFREAGKVFLYYQGVKVGENVYEDYKKYVKTNEEILFLFTEVVRAIGWGVVEAVHVDFDEKFFLIKIYESIECELCKPANEPCGYFSKGVIAGLFSKLTNTSLKVNEIMCIAKGDPYCLFEVKR